MVKLAHERQVFLVEFKARIGFIQKDQKNTNSKNSTLEPLNLLLSELWQFTDSGILQHGFYVTVFLGIFV